MKARINQQPTRTPTNLYSIPQPFWAPLGFTEKKKKNPKLYVNLSMRYILESSPANNSQNIFFEFPRPGQTKQAS